MAQGGKATATEAQGGSLNQLLCFVLTSYCFEHIHMQGTCVVELKRLVAEKTAHLVGVDYQLVHGRDTLEYDKTLEDYPSLGHGSTLQLLVPLPGGAEVDIDPTLPRIDDEPCMITKESFEENGTVVLMMPCGHPISPEGLMDYCSWGKKACKGPRNKIKTCKGRKNKTIR